MAPILIGLIRLEVFAPKAEAGNTQHMGWKAHGTQTRTRSTAQALRGRKELLGSAHMDTLMTANNYGRSKRGYLRVGG